MDPNATSTPGLPGKNRGLLCPKCEHLNTADVLKCKLCEAPLFIDCNHCGGRVQSVFSNCPKCHKPLGKKVSQRKKEAHKRFHLLLWLYNVPMDKLFMGLAAILGFLCFVFFLTRM